MQEKTTRNKSQLNQFCRQANILKFVKSAKAYDKRDIV